MVKSQRINLNDKIKGKISSKLTFQSQTSNNKTTDHGQAIDQTTSDHVKNYREETRPESNPHLTPRPR